MLNRFKIPLQFFAEGDPPANPPTPTPAEPATGKTFSEDYVKTLREESKTHRLAWKETEKKLKAVIGLKDTDEIDDTKIAAYQTSQNAKITAAEQKANAKLILAEIKSLDGYNPKLVSALLDRSKVTIAEDGTVTGLKEAVEALAVEYPEIKKITNSPAPSNSANPPQNGNPTELEKLKTDYAAAQKAGNLAEQIALKNKIFALENKK